MNRKLDSDNIEGEQFFGGRWGSSRWKQEPSEKHQSYQGSQGLGWSNRRILLMGKLRPRKTGQSPELSLRLLTSRLVLGWPSSSQVLNVLACHLGGKEQTSGCSQNVRVKQGPEERDTQ